MRILFILIAWTILATFAPQSLQRPAPAPARASISFEPLAFDRVGQAKKRFGRLLYLRGWVLRSDDFRFGGISAMHVGDRQVLAVSDAGFIFRLSRPDAPGLPSILVRPLPNGPGSATRKSDRDAESMVVNRDKVWIGFERSNTIWRYGQFGQRSEAASQPRAMRKWRANSGSEAMLRLPDGRFMVFSEGSRESRTSPIILFDGDPTIRSTRTHPLSYRPPEGYRITDADLLPDGTILILNRRFSWFEGASAKLVLLKLPPLKAGMTLIGTEVADLRSPAPIDNMEALSVGREQGRTIVWIASDDNFNPLQRSLMLKFALVDK